MHTTITMARKQLIPTEHVEQCRLFAWCALKTISYPDLEWLYAIPNFSGHYGDQTSRLIAGKRLKAEGRKSGYPDIGLDVPRGPYHGLRIELKRLEGGRVDPEQTVWHERLQGQGYHVVVCKGWEAARDALLAYLALPIP